MKFKKLLATTAISLALAFPAFAANVGDKVVAGGACKDPQSLEAIVTAPEAEQGMVLQEAVKVGVCALFPQGVPMILKAKIKTVKVDGKFMEIWEVDSPFGFPIYVIGPDDGQDA